MKIIIDFLKELQQNNNREWFKANKSKYDTSREAFEEFVGLLIHEISDFDPAISGLTPKQCIFRIYRDVRFSKDKSPYKTNFGAIITKGGRKSPYAGYYLHIEPGASFLAGGAYMPEKDLLSTIRHEIFKDPESFMSIIESKTFSKYFEGLWGEKLKRPPRRFDADFEHIEILKHKSFVALHEVKDKTVLSPRFLQYCTEVYSNLRPFNSYFNNLIEQAAPDIY